MPDVYQSHVSAPDFTKIAEDYRPFDLVAAVDRAHEAAQQMTINQQKIQSNQADLALHQATAPYEIMEAKTRADMLVAEKQKYDIVNAPDALRSHLDAQMAQDKLQIEQAKLKGKQDGDQADLMAHTADIADLSRAAQDNPARYLAMRSGLLSVLKDNSAFAPVLAGIDQKFDATDFPGADKVLQKGSYLRAHQEEATKYAGMGSMTQDDVTRVKIATAKSAQRTMMSAAGMNPDQVVTAEKAIDAVDAARFNSVGPLADKIIQAEQSRAKMMTDQGVSTPPVPSDLTDVTQYGKLGDTKMASDFTKWLDNNKTAMTTRLSQLSAGARPVYAGEEATLNERLAKSDAMEKQLATVGFHAWRGVMPATVARGWNALSAKWFGSGQAAGDEFDRFQAIRDEYQKSNPIGGTEDVAARKEATKKLFGLAWDMTQGKDIAEHQKNLAELPGLISQFNSILGGGSVAPGTPEADGMVKVTRKADGQSGMIPAAQFDPAKYDQVQ